MTDDYVVFRASQDVAAWKELFWNYDIITPALKRAASGAELPTPKRAREEVSDGAAMVTNENPGQAGKEEGAGVPVSQDTKPVRGEPSDVEGEEDPEEDDTQGGAVQEEEGEEEQAEMDEEVPAEEAEASSAGGPTAEQATGDTGGSQQATAATEAAPASLTDTDPKMILVRFDDPPGEVFLKGGRLYVIATGTKKRLSPRSLFTSLGGRCTHVEKLAKHTEDSIEYNLMKSTRVIMHDSVVTVADTLSAAVKGIYGKGNLSANGSVPKKVVNADGVEVNLRWQPKSEDGPFFKAAKLSSKTIACMFNVQINKDGIIQPIGASIYLYKCINMDVTEKLLD